MAIYRTKKNKSIYQKISGKLQKMPKKILVLIFVFLFAVICAIGVKMYFVHQNREREIIVNRAGKLKEITVLVKKIDSIWRYGDVYNYYKNGKVQCKQEFGEFETFNGREKYNFKCNPGFLECLLREGVLLEKGIDAVSNPTGAFLQLLPSSEYSFSNLMFVNKMVWRLVLQKGELSFFVYLENNCNEVYLPQKIYATKHDNDKIFMWKNEKNIYIDRYMVTYQEVLNWAKSTKDLSDPLFKKLPDDPLLLNRTAVNLTKNQMEEYCSFWGKQLLKTHLYDAATYIPYEDASWSIDRYPLDPYPWSRKKSAVFLSQKKSLKDLTEDDCNRSYVKECKALMPYKIISNSSSWMGIQQILGGPFEYLINPLMSSASTGNIMNEKENLKASSYYFGVSDTVHQLGKRFSWTGEDHSMESVDFGDSVLEDSELALDIGFRCYKEVYLPK